MAKYIRFFGGAMVGWGIGSLLSASLFPDAIIISVGYIMVIMSYGWDDKWPS